MKPSNFFIFAGLREKDYREKDYFLVNIVKKHLQVNIICFNTSKECIREKNSMLVNSVKKVLPRGHI